MQLKLIYHILHKYPLYEIKLNLLHNILPIIIPPAIKLKQRVKEPHVKLTFPCKRSCTSFASMELKWKGEMSSKRPMSPNNPSLYETQSAMISTPFIQYTN